MAGFIPKETDQLEKQIKHCLVADLPLNSSSTNFIGEGSSGVVFRHIVRKKPAAVKLYKCNITKASILRSAIKLRSLKNENVVRFRGYSERPSALIFELCGVTVQGTIVHNLSQLLSLFNENGYLNLEERTDYIYQATRGLKYLHEHDIVHRDFKPANLLVNGHLENINVKVADFDIVTKIKETIVTTSTINKFRGMTLAYVSPEICLQKVKMPSTVTDIYAWSISAFQILSNLSSPWENVLPILSDTMLLKAIGEDERPDIEDLLQHYPENIKQIRHLTNLICQAWQCEASKRPSLENVKCDRC